MSLPFIFVYKFFDIAETGTAMFEIGARPVLPSTFRLGARHDKPQRVICTQASSFDAAHERWELVKKSSPGVMLL
ncbi:hypothetical protein RHMOL_Rhmol11G0252800 [Rhododendron molle]|uniref:Uncharacterized protein n=1 Tax=Rhododendron molle TaxID=49168 RepID=A0ACC0LX02_RHOML|nr:hypothetical protein RHMOL_Rhmol11G0252800 [Rhododendron molle]